MQKLSLPEKKNYIPDYQDFSNEAETSNWFSAVLNKYYTILIMYY